MGRTLLAAAFDFELSVLAETIRQELR